MGTLNVTNIQWEAVKGLNLFFYDIAELSKEEQYVFWLQDQYNAAQEIFLEKLNSNNVKLQVGSFLSSVFTVVFESNSKCVVCM